MRAPARSALFGAFAASLLAAGAAQAAPPPPPAERARALEEVGRFAEAARLYEAALKDDKAPALLYRLALCKRHLGDYAGAREALRGYLREEPGGPLRVEVERQLAQLQVLIEERGLHPERAPHPAVAKPAPGSGSGSGPAAAGTGAAAGAVSGASAGPGPGAASAPASVLPPGSASAPAAVSASTGTRTAAATTDIPSAAASATAPALTAAAVSAPVPLAAPVPRSAPAAAAAPAAALAPPPAGSPLRTALPLAAGAAAAGLAGGLLLWDGARVSSDLDARFAAGELTAADQPRYTRAHRESAAGVALVSLAVLAVGAAVWLVAF